MGLRRDEEVVGQGRGSGHGLRRGRPESGGRGPILGGGAKATCACPGGRATVGRGRSGWRGTELTLQEWELPDGETLPGAGAVHRKGSGGPRAKVRGGTWRN